MRILIVGATGTIGVPVVQALEVRHEVIPASHSRSALTVDLGEAESIRRLYAKVGRVEAVVSIAGQAAFRPLLALTDADFALGLNNKLMGQVNLVRFGIEMVTDGGSFTLTSGILSRMPMPGQAGLDQRTRNLRDRSMMTSAKRAPSASSSLTSTASATSRR